VSLNNLLENAVDKCGTLFTAADTPSEPCYTIRTMLHHQNHATPSEPCYSGCQDIMR